MLMDGNAPMTTPPDSIWLARQASRTLNRMLPRIEARFADQPQRWPDFRRRLDAHFPRLFGLLFQLYGQHYDFLYHIERTLEAAADATLARPADLHALDVRREAEPDWLQSHTMLGGVCYVDLFAGNLDGIRASIPYFKELGLTYLHLMPLFLAPAGENDGGYAVSDYRTVNPALGSMEQLAELAREFRRDGISLVVDFIFNHTSDEHAWAQRAIAGDEDYREFYYFFPDRTMPDAYEQTLREIFPDEHPGAFTYRTDVQSWVWTTFHSYQWDLNYTNPAVFTAMAEEMLFLANVGVEVLRLDAVAFVWKELGTSCENLPQAHWIIQAFNALTQIAAPALYFKSEAIVHPDDVARYISTEECQLSYNPLLMALLWNTLATREVNLLQFSLQQRFAIAPGCAWVNYVRCHDDIGWTFADDDARHIGIHDGFGHRLFLNNFYTGRFPGSFARGLPFQANPKTGDARISGTCASLAGLEEAIRRNNEREIELAMRRILLIHSIILSIGGIPLLYLGDEIGTLNDYSYGNDPALACDSRWVHRPHADDAAYARRLDPTTIAGQIYTRMRELILIRKQTEAFAGTATDVINVGNQHVFGYVRHNGKQRVLILANFSERDRAVAANDLRIYGLSYQFTDLITGQPVQLADRLLLEPYQAVWLKPVE